MPKASCPNWRKPLHRNRPTDSCYLPNTTDSKRWGRWAESAVGAYLVNNAEEFGYQVYYWREDNMEVDFILEKKGKTIAIEVKSGRREINNGISIFSKKFSPKLAIVVGSGAFSFEEFFTMDLGNLFEE